MSTKKMQRSVIEGGRANFNKWERRNSSKEQRAKMREYLGCVSKDINYADKQSEPQQERVSKVFTDKLNPMYRWLNSQVGRIWNDVRSEICSKFDTRTVAGRHIVYDHLLSSVEEVPDLKYKKYFYGPEDDTTSYYKNDFYVEEGVLKKKTYIPRKSNKTPKFNLQSLTNWLGGCVVGKVGNKLFWFVPADKNKKYGGTAREWKTEWSNQRYHYNFYSAYGVNWYYSYQEAVYDKNKQGILEIVGYKKSWRSGLPNFRQDRKLNEKEIQFWNSIPEWYQTRILEHSPTYPKDLKLVHKYY